MKTQESPRLSAALLPLLIFLSTSEVHSRYLPHCNTSSCGDIEDISYPFRLKTDPVGCGLPDFELSCENNKTILEFHSGKYYVKRISYDEHLIRLVDINLANGTCSLPYKSLSVDEVLNDAYFKIYSGTYTSFVRCSSNLSDQVYRKVPCLSGNGSSVYVTYSNYVISDLQGVCTFVSRVPTAYQAVLFPSYVSILQLMQSGFDLQWSFGCEDNPYNYRCYEHGFYLAFLLVETFITDILHILIVINLIARYILAPIFLIGFLIHKYRTKDKTVDNKEMVMVNRQPLVLRRYSYSEIVAITDQFNYELGQGGYGKVYKGKLPNGCFVAVKMLVNSKGSDKDFIDEVSTIGGIHHVNVIQLLGFCSEGSNRALVFEYMPNGSLDKYIFTREAEIQPLSWEKLLRIALGTAQGIEHLHGGCDVCILHFDIKPQNVFLDNNFIPKVSDFGLAKFYPKENDFVSVLTARGTLGYIAPELISGNVGAISCKSDVYSFGMLLLEMAGGRRNAHIKGSSSSELYFPLWVYGHLSGGGDLELENATKVEAAIARKLCLVGLWCIQKTASDRPSMSKVVEMLEGNVDNLQMPTNQLSFPQRNSEEPQSDSSTELLISETAEKSL